MYDGTVTAQQAETARRAKLSVPNKRKVPHMLGIIEKLKESRQYHIFNVGPWAHQISTGSTGIFYIPACPTEKECQEKDLTYKPYVEMTRSIGAIVDELIPKSEAEFDRLMDDGREFALEVIGEGRGQQQAFAIKRKGVFLAEGDKPTREELHKANLELRATCAEIVAEIRSIYATDQKLFSQVVRPNVHYVAAWVLGLYSEKWMTETTPSGQIRCKLCGSMSDSDVAMCGNGHIINQALYDEYMAEQEAMMAGTAERAARPAAKSKAK